MIVPYFYHDNGGAVHGVGTCDSDDLAETQKTHPHNVVPILDWSLFHEMRNNGAHNYQVSGGVLGLLPQEAWRQPPPIPPPPTDWIADLRGKALLFIEYMNDNTLATNLLKEEIAGLREDMKRVGQGLKPTHNV